MSSMFQPLSSVDTFAGSSQRIEATITAMGMKEWWYSVLAEGMIGTYTTAALRPKFQIAPEQFNGLSIGQQSTTVRRPWADVDLTGPQGHLLLDKDWPDPFPLGVLITRRLLLGGPFRARMVLRQQFTGAGAVPNQPSFIVSTASEIRW